MWGALSDERTGLSFTSAPGPRQYRHFRVRLSWDSWPYFTVSDSRLSLFVASYDSQGYGGGIRPRLHTGYSLVMAAGPRYIASAWTAQKTPLHLLRVLSLPGKQRVVKAVP
jgi:hypothetical protein